MLNPIRKILKSDLLYRSNITSIIPDFLLPRFCVYCEEKLSPGEYYLCQGCFFQVSDASKELLQHEFDRKFRGLSLIDNFRAAFIFEKEKPLQALIHRLKYSYNFDAGEFLGKLTGEKLKNELASLEIRYLIPVPIHKLKKYHRGYNQTEYIAKGISKVTGIEILSDVLIRGKHTGTQSKLKIDTRKRNITDVFEVNDSGKIAEVNIAIVDDIVTTGATMNECAKVLKQQSAGNITALSVAIAG